MPAKTSGVVALTIGRKTPAGVSSQSLALEKPRQACVTRVAARIRRVMELLLTRILVIARRVVIGRFTTSVIRIVSLLTARVLSISVFKAVFLIVLPFQRVITRRQENALLPRVIVIIPEKEVFQGLAGL